MNTEAGAATSGLVCHDPAQSNLSPFGEMTDQHQATHGPTTGPSTEDRGSKGDGPRLNEEEIAEIQWRSEEVAREARKLGQAVILIPAIIVACQLALHA